MADKVKENESSNGTLGVLNKELLKNPEVLAALQHHCGNMPAHHVASLPKVVKRRLKALKKLQAETNQIESKFYEELHKLECQYQLQFQPLFAKRSEIINAIVEPTDEMCDWPDEDPATHDPLSDKFEQMKIEGSTEQTPSSDAQKLDETTKGIPEFWLTILKNVDMLREMVQPHDEPILKHLQDIRVVLDTETGFTLEFCFEPNDYFSNTILTKQYFLRFQVDNAVPLLFEGPEVYKSIGTTIDWQQGKNVTVRLIKKVQKHKGRGTKRVVTKTIQADSFFNFFNPPQVVEGETVDDDTEALLDADFEIGQFFRERIVPRAVLYFTGEAIEDEDDEYEDDDYEDGEDDGEDDAEDEDEDDDKNDN
jgi:nucleosome assembly protein 1-like 1